MWIPPQSWIGASQRNAAQSSLLCQIWILAPASTQFILTSCLSVWVSQWVGALDQIQELLYTEVDLMTNDKWDVRIIMPEFQVATVSQWIQSRVGGIIACIWFKRSNEYESNTTATGLHECGQMIPSVNLQAWSWPISIGLNSCHLNTPGKCARFTTFFVPYSDFIQETVCAHISVDAGQFYSVIWSSSGLTTTVLWWQKFYLGGPAYTCLNLFSGWQCIPQEVWSKGVLPHAPLLSQYNNYNSYGTCHQVATDSEDVKYSVTFQLQSSSICLCQLSSAVSACGTVPHPIHPLTLKKKCRRQAYSFHFPFVLAVSLYTVCKSLGAYYKSSWSKNLEATSHSRLSDLLNSVGPSPGWVVTEIAVFVWTCPLELLCLLQCHLGR